MYKHRVTPANTPRWDLPRAEVRKNRRSEGNFLAILLSVTCLYVICSIVLRFQLLTININEIIVN